MSTKSSRPISRQALLDSSLKSDTLLGCKQSQPLHQLVHLTADKRWWRCSAIIIINRRRVDIIAKTRRRATSCHRRLAASVSCTSSIRLPCEGLRRPTSYHYSAPVSISSLRPFCIPFGSK